MEILLDSWIEDKTSHKDVPHETSTSCTRVHVYFQLSFDIRPNTRVPTSLQHQLNERSCIEDHEDEQHDTRTTHTDTHTHTHTTRPRQIHTHTDTHTHVKQISNSSKYWRKEEKNPNDGGDITRGFFLIGLNVVVHHQKTFTLYFISTCPGTPPRPPKRLV